MKKLLGLGLLIFFPILLTLGQEVPEGQVRIDRNNLSLRPNSRDYNIVRKGDNHQRVVQMRTQAMVRHKQAMLNRKMAMERRHTYMQQQMMRKQHNRQRLIRQQGMHR